MQNFEEFYQKCFNTLTPVEKIEEFWIKREDLFEPFEKNGVNGSKLRQLIYLTKQFIENENAKGIIAGAVSASPQHYMAARVCKHFGIKCLIVTGAKEIQKFPMLKFAVENGAEFYIANISYPSALQGIAFKLKEEKYKDYSVLETNITLSEKLHSSEEIKNFHLIGAEQVKNIPENIKTLIIPCGSCNSAVSVLLGLKLYGHKNIEDIYLMGIGSWGSKDIGYVFRRLSLILGEEYKDKGLNFSYFNLNGENFCKYSDKFYYKIGNLEFHPTYEAKIMKYLEVKNLIKEFNKTLIWNIGKEPKI